MKKIVLFVFLILITQSFNVYAKTYQVVNSGTSFSPADLTIEVGDSVNFSLSSSHNAVEVSKKIFDAGGNESNKGFSLDFGGGKVAFDSLGVFYYVCQPHASMGMKGIIRVVDKLTSSVQKFSDGAEVSVFPNPSNGFLHVKLSNTNESLCSLKLYSMTGSLIHIYTFTGIRNDGSNLRLDGNTKGIYILEITTDMGKYQKPLVLN